MKIFQYLCPIPKNRLAELWGDQQLTAEELIIQEGEEYRLNDVYVAMKYRIIGTLSSRELGLIEHVGSNKTGGYQLTSKGKRFLTENGYHWE